MIARWREAARLRAQHPREPWLWRPDWAARAVRDTSYAGTGCMWGVAIFWTLVSLPIALMALMGRQEPFFYLALIFPLAGLVMIGVAVHQTLRRSKYGLSVCRIDRLPIPLGGTFGAEIEAAIRELPPEGVLVQLTCVRVTIVRTGRSRTKRESILWQDEQTLRHGMMPGPNGLRIPVRFAIPADAPPADEQDANDRVVWRLQVSAEVPGIDYAATFELPVFGDAGASAFPAAPRPDPSSWTPPPDITVGSPGIVLHPRRRIGDWVGYVFFLTMWYGVLYFFGTRDVPLMVLIVMGVIGAFVFVAALDFLLGRTTLTTERGVLTIRRTWLGLGTTETIPAPEIDRFEPRIGTTVGNRAYHDVHAILRTGGSRKVAKYIRNRRDAEMLAARLGRGVG